MTWFSCTQFIQKQLIEYFEYAKDPIKLYFQEKASNLFLRKEIVALFLEEDKSPTDPQPKVQMLSNSFLNFSEIREVNERTSRHDLGSIRLESKVFVATPKGKQNGETMESYDKAQLAKKVDMVMMVKVKDEMNNKETKVDTTASKLMNFEKNDSLIASSLESQTSAVNNRLAKRKANSMLKGGMSRIWYEE